MNGKIASITEYDSITVLALGIIANGTRRVFRGKSKVGFWYIFGLRIKRA